MIQLFRHIRKSFLMENKTSKYLKYAIGEIILVVIGILIALSINNWNNHQKDLAKEQKVLLQLQGEYRKNLAQLKQKITMRNEIIQSSQNILKYIDNPQNVTKDSIIYHLNYIVRDPTFDPIVNDLIASGNLYLIKNDSLKQKLNEVNLMDNFKMNILKKDQTLSVFTNSKTIKINIYDGGKEDGDKITILVNNKIVLNTYEANKLKKFIDINLENRKTSIVIKANNEGDISPNTVVVEIDDGMNLIKALSNLKKNETTQIDFLKH